MRTTLPKHQLREVIQRFDLAGLIKPFQRCMACNQMLEVIPKAEVQGRVPPEAFLLFDEFVACQGCDRIYWKGTHYERMQTFIKEILS